MNFRYVAWLDGWVDWKGMGKDDEIGLFWEALRISLPTKMVWEELSLTGSKWETQYRKAESNRI